MALFLHNTRNANTERHCTLETCWALGYLLQLILMRTWNSRAQTGGLRVREVRHLLEVAEPGLGQALLVLNSGLQGVGEGRWRPGALHRAVPCFRLPCCGPPGPPHLAGIIGEAPPELQQGQPHQHRGCLRPSGEGHQQGLVGVVQAAQAVQGIGRQEARSLILRVQLHQEHGQLVHATGVPVERAAGRGLTPVLHPSHLPREAGCRQMLSPHLVQAAPLPLGLRDQVPAGRALVPSPERTAALSDIQPLALTTPPTILPHPIGWAFYR